MVKHIFLLLLALCFINVISAQNESEKVAVYVTGGIDAAYKTVVGSKIVSTITESGEIYGFHSAVSKISTFYVDIPVKERLILDSDSDGYLGSGSNRIEYPLYIYLLKD